MQSRVEPRGSREARSHHPPRSPGDPPAAGRAPGAAAHGTEPASHGGRDSHGSCPLLPACAATAGRRPFSTRIPKETYPTAGHGALTPGETEQARSLACEARQSSGCALELWSGAPQVPPAPRRAAWPLDTQPSDGSLEGRRLPTARQATSRSTTHYGNTTAWRSFAVTGRLHLQVRATSSKHSAYCKKQKLCLLQELLTHF